MTRKPTGLAAFGTKQPEPEAMPAPAPASSRSGPLAKPRKRAQGETVAMTFRVARIDWQRLHALAVAEGVSLQSLCHDGLSKVLAEHGQAPMQS